MNTASAGALRTYIFGLEKGSAGPLALGCGACEAEAMRDAHARLRQRYPGARTPQIAHLSKRLAQEDVAVIHSAAEPYPRQEQLGHEYMSNETYMLAVSFGSDLAARHLVDASDGSSHAVRLALEPMAKSYLRHGRLDLMMVDWSEVGAECMSEARAQEVAARDYSACASSQSAGSLLSLVSGKAPRRIDAAVLDVLRECTVAGQHVYLPKVRLDPKLYAKVNEVLVALGGKWVGRKVQAHVFEDDPSAVLDVAVGTGTFVKPQDFGYFPTPKPLVDRLIRLADLQPFMRVLEPEAGCGGIAIPAAAVVGFDLVTAVELLPGNARKLRDAGFKHVHEGDFLAVEPTFSVDRVLMNPPFSNMADVEHVMHAAKFLGPTGRLAAITSPAWTHHSTRKAGEFREFAAACDADVVEIERGAFREAGTDVATRIVTIDAANLPWNRRHVERQRA